MDTAAATKEPTRRVIVAERGTSWLSDEWLADGAVVVARTRDESPTQFRARVERRVLELGAAAETLIYLTTHIESRPHQHALFRTAQKLGLQFHVTEQTGNIASAAA